MRTSRLGVLVALSLVVAVVQGCRGDADAVGVDESHVVGGVAHVPTSDADKGNVAVDGDATNLFTNVDDGTSFASADDGATTVRNHWGTLVSHYAAGYSGFPSGSVSAAAVYYRARADSGVSATIQVNLYDGATVVASGPERTLSSSFADYTETFLGLSAANANALRTEVVIRVPGGTGYARCTQMWLEASVTSSDAGAVRDGAAVEAGSDAGACGSSSGGAAVSLLPTSDVDKGNVTADGSTTSLYTDVDDGSAFASADDAATDVRNHWADSSASYTAGFSGSATGITKVVASFRANADAGIGGTAQIKLYDGATLVGTGAVHALGSSWTNVSDTFTGLAPTTASSLRAQVVLGRAAATGYVRVTQLWLDAMSGGATGTCDAGSPSVDGGGGTPLDAGATTLDGGASASDPIFVGAGDISICGGSANGEQTAKVLDGIFANGANASGVVYTLGDNAYNDGLLSEYQTCYGPTWGRHKARTRPSPGNHERDISSAGGYFQYYGAAAGDASRGAYYSYDLGKWHVVSLDSFGEPISAGSAQEQWLRADLAAHPSQCTLAYFHAPRFNSGSSHGSQTFMQPVWQDLYDAGADVVLSGHEHVYERFAPQTPAGAADPARGIRQFTVGTGGGTLYTFGTALPNSEVRYNGSYGVLKLTLHAASYDWEFVPEAGASFTDRGTGACH